MNDAIVDNLESLYHIQFGMETRIQNGHHQYRLYPVEDRPFVVDITFTATRVSADLEPKASAQFVNDMGMQPESKRILFTKHANIIRSHGYKISMSINDRPVDPVDNTMWGDNWRKMKLHITRVLDESESNPEAIVLELSPLVMGMILSLAVLVPNDEQWKHMDGAEKERWVKTYERNPINRAICISVKGTRCSVCDLDFGERYGEIGTGFIHVHHIIPVSRMNGPRELNPLTDLIPVCPNCHYMLHRRDPPFPPDELRDILKNNNHE